MQEHCSPETKPSTLQPQMFNRVVSIPNLNLHRDSYRLRDTMPSNNNNAFNEKPRTVSRGVNIEPVNTYVNNDQNKNTKPVNYPISNILGNSSNNSLSTNRILY